MAALGRQGWRKKHVLPCSRQRKGQQQLPSGDSAWGFGSFWKRSKCGGLRRERSLLSVCESRRQVCVDF